MQELSRQMTSLTACSLEDLHRLKDQDPSYLKEYERREHLLRMIDPSQQDLIYHLKIIALVYRTIGEGDRPLILKKFLNLYVFRFKKAVATKNEDEVFALFKTLFKIAECEVTVWDRVLEKASELVQREYLSVERQIDKIKILSFTKIDSLKNLIDQALNKIKGFNNPFERCYSLLKIIPFVHKSDPKLAKNLTMLCSMAANELSLSIYDKQIIYMELVKAFSFFDFEAALKFLNLIDLSSLQYTSAYFVAKKVVHIDATKISQISKTIINPELSAKIRAFSALWLSNSNAKAALFLAAQIEPANSASSLIARIASCIASKDITTAIDYTQNEMLTLSEKKTILKEIAKSLTFENYEMKKSESRAALDQEDFCLIC